MTPVFKKLNFKNQDRIVVINAPDSFRQELLQMEGTASVTESLSRLKSVSFFLAFVTKQKEVDDLAKAVAPLAEGDAIIWFAYPKGTSKRYKCEFNRDNGWAELGRNGYEGVRMVAIDEDWSALRFRKVEHIKTMTRSFAMSEAGRKKAALKKKSS